MSKITLSPISNPQNLTSLAATINANNATLVSAMDNTLSLDGTAPNQMQSNFDMNNFQILNLPAPGTTNSPARLIDVVSNPTITVPPTGTSGAVVGFLNGNNTYSGTSTFSGTVNLNSVVNFGGSSITLPATVNGNSTFTGNLATTGTLSNTGGITVTNNTGLGVKVTDGANPTTFANLQLASNWSTQNLSFANTPISLIEYIPTQTSSTAQTLMLDAVNARLQLRSRKADSSGINPQIVLGDLGVFGTPVIGGGNHTGVGIVGNGVSGTSTFVIDLVHTGGASTGEFNSLNLNLWNTDSAGNTQNFICFFNGSGTSVWNGTLGATPAGARLGEIGGCGSLPDGHFTQTETWSMNGYADSTFSGTTNDGTYTAFTNIVFRNAVKSSSPETVTGGFYSPGTFALGEWAAFGNNFTGGPGSVTMKNCIFTPGTMAGGGVLFVASGALQYRGSSGTLTTIAPA